jgi:hypothetical protein
VTITGMSEIFTSFSSLPMGKMKEREQALRETQGWLGSSQLFPMSFEEVSKFVDGFRCLMEKPVQDTVREDQTPLPF